MFYLWLLLAISGFSSLFCLMFDTLMLFATTRQRLSITCVLVNKPFIMWPQESEVLYAPQLSYLISHWLCVGLENLHINVTINQSFYWFYDLF